MSVLEVADAACVSNAKQRHSLGWVSVSATGIEQDDAPTPFEKIIIIMKNKLTLEQW